MAKRRLALEGGGDMIQSEFEHLLMSVRLYPLFLHED